MKERKVKCLDAYHGNIVFETTEGNIERFIKDINDYWTNTIGSGHYLLPVNDYIGMRNAYFGIDCPFEDREFMFPLDRKLQMSKRVEECFGVVYCISAESV